MNFRQKRPPPTIRHPAWRRAIQSLNEALERNSDPDDNSRKIDLLRLALFGVADECCEPKPPE